MPFVYSCIRELYGLLSFPPRLNSVLSLEAIHRSLFRAVVTDFSSKRFPALLIPHQFSPTDIFSADLHESSLFSPIFTHQHLYSSAVCTPSQRGSDLHRHLLAFSSCCGSSSLSAIYPVPVSAHPKSLHYPLPGLVKEVSHFLRGMKQPLWNPESITCCK